MKKAIFLTVLLGLMFLVNLHGQQTTQVTAIQYYFNNDPGQGVAGNGGIINVTPSDTLTQVFNFNLPGGISEGINYLYVRAQDQAGHWSQIARQPLFVVSGLNPAPITALEFYYDTDPGVGNATRLEVFVTDSLNEVYQLPAPCLSVGTHYLYVRAQDTSGHWSLVARDTLNILPSVEPSIIAQGDSLLFCPEDSLELAVMPAPGVMYQWMRNGVDITGGDSSTYFTDTTGYFTVRATCNGMSAVSDSIWVGFDTLITVYADKDGDGYGDPMDSLRVCLLPVGYVRTPFDCDDHDSLIHPARIELCDSIDNNCNGMIDEGLVGFTDTLERAICEGDTAMIGGIVRSSSGFYIHRAGPLTCDSFVAVNLSVHPVDTLRKSEVVPSPDSAGVFTFIYTSSKGCDSVVICTRVYLRSALADSLILTEIMFNPPEFGSDSLEFVELYNRSSSPINLSGFSFTQAFNHTFGNVVVPPGEYLAIGIDSGAVHSQFGVSILQWNSGMLGSTSESIVLEDAQGLVVDSVRYADTLPWPAETDGGGASMVLCDYTLDRNDPTSWLTSQSGTGKIIKNKHLRGSPGFQDRACLNCPNPDTVLLSATTCDRHQADTTYQTFTGGDGCDSVVTTVYTFYPETITDLPDQTICPGGTATIFGIVRTTAGTYRDTVPNAHGCDSILRLELIMAPTYLDTLAAASVCEGQSITVLGNLQSAAGYYVDSAFSIIGCDSVTYQLLTVNPTDTSFTTVTTNDPGMNGQVDTTYLSNQFGCDSLLIVTKVFVSTCTNDTTYQSFISCDSSMAGVMINIYPKADGCDSVVIDSISYDPPDFNGLPTVEICEGDSLLIFNEWRSTSGLYFDTLANINGCDSILIKELIVNPRVYDTLSFSINQGDSLFLAGAWRSMSGTFLDTFAASTGCDSILANVLTVLDTAGCSPENLTLASDSMWWQSTVVDPGSWGPWPGSTGLPAAGTYTQQAQVGQPYGSNRTRVWLIEGTLPIRAENNVRYFRRSFSLTDATDVTARIRMYMDDDVEVYINGHLLAREEDIDPQNFKGAYHDILFPYTGQVANGYMGGQMFDYALGQADPDSIFQTGMNQVVLALRNLKNASNQGGFSFRMDIANCGDTSFVMKKASVFGFADLQDIQVYPNPTSSAVNLSLPELGADQHYRVSLFDVNGRLLQERSVQSRLGGSEEQLSLRTYADGIYLLRIHSPSEMFTIKVVKH